MPDQLEQEQETPAEAQPQEQPRSLLRPWSEAEPVIRQAFPDGDIDAMRRMYEGHRELLDWRDRLRGAQEQPWTAVGRHVLDTFGVMSTTQAVQHRNALQRLQEGRPEPEDPYRVAQIERLHELDQQATSTLGGQLWRTAQGLPGQALGFMAIGARIPGAGIGAGATGATGFLTRQGVAAGRGAATMALNPEWVGRGIQNEMAHPDRGVLENYGAPLTIAALNGAILGQLGAVSEILAGSGAARTAGRLAIGTGAGLAEQQIADAASTAIARWLGIEGLDTGYGTIGTFLSAMRGTPDAQGRPAPAMRDAYGHALTQAMTFAAFSAMHQGGREIGIRDRFVDASRALRRQGLSRAGAGERLADPIFNRLLTDESMTPDQAEAAIERQPAGPLQEYARAIYESRPAEAVGQAPTAADMSATEGALAEADADINRRLSGQESPQVVEPQRQVQGEQRPGQQTLREMFRNVDVLEGEAGGRPIEMRFDRERNAVNIDFDKLPGAASGISREGVQPGTRELVRSLIDVASRARNEGLGVTFITDPARAAHYVRGLEKRGFKAIGEPAAVEGRPTVKRYTFQPKTAEAPRTPPASSVTAEAQAPTEAPQDANLRPVSPSGGRAAKPVRTNREVVDQAVESLVATGLTKKYAAGHIERALANAGDRVFTDQIELIRAAFAKPGQKPEVAGYLKPTPQLPRVGEAPQMPGFMRQAPKVGSLANAVERMRARSTGIAGIAKTVAPKVGLKPTEAAVEALGRRKAAEQHNAEVAAVLKAAEELAAVKLSRIEQFIIDNRESMTQEAIGMKLGYPKRTARSNVQKIEKKAMAKVGEAKSIAVRQREAAAQAQAEAAARQEDFNVEPGELGVGARQRSEMSAEEVAHAGEVSQQLARQGDIENAVKTLVNAGVSEEIARSYVEASVRRGVQSESAFAPKKIGEAQAVTDFFTPPEEQGSLYRESQQTGKPLGSMPVPPSAPLYKQNERADRARDAAKAKLDAAVAQAGGKETLEVKRARKALKQAENAANRAARESGDAEVHESWAIEARDMDLDTAGLRAEAERIRVESVDPDIAGIITSGRRSLRKQGIRIEGYAGEDYAAIPGFDTLVDRMEVEHPGIFPRTHVEGGARDAGSENAQKLFDLLTSGHAERMSLDTAYNQASARLLEARVRDGEARARSEGEQESDIAAARQGRGELEEGQGETAGEADFPFGANEPGFGRPVSEAEHAAALGGPAGREITAYAAPQGAETARVEFRPDETALAKAKADLERAFLHLPEAPGTIHRPNAETWAKTLDAVAREPGVDARLVQELLAKPRQITLDEGALLLHRKIDLANQHERAALRLIGEIRPGGKADPKVVAELTALESELLRQNREVMDVIKLGGTGAGQTLQWFGQLAKRDFTLASMMMQREVALKRPLTGQEKAQILELSNQIKELQGKLDAAEAKLAKAGTGSKGSEFTEWQQIRIDAMKSQQNWGRQIAGDRWDNMTRTQKTLDWLRRARIAEVISSPATIGKVGMSSVWQTVAPPVRELIGSALRLVPGIRQIAQRAPVEGRGLRPSVEVAALRGTVTKGAKDAWQTIREGRSELDVQYGTNNDQAYTWLDFFGTLHAAEKAPAVRNAYERAFRNIEASEVAAGRDVTSPAALHEIGMRAYQEGIRAKFQQDNAVVEATNNMINSLKKGTNSPAAKVIGHTLDLLMPVRRTPTNIVADALEHIGGLPVGIGRAAWAGWHGIKNLKPEQADSIMRMMKKGTLGLPLLALGYYAATNLGGFYSGRRREDDLRPGETRIGAATIPAWPTVHHPVFIALQLGATIRRAEQGSRRQDVGLVEGTARGMGALVEQVPMVREQTEVARMFEHGFNSKAVGNLARSLAVPQLIQWAAQQMDKTPRGELQERRPQSFLQTIKLGIPGLRQNVPVRR